MLKWLWSCSAWLNFLAMFQTSAICFNAPCTKSMHISLECKQRKWPLKHLCPQTLFHRQRTCPQLDVAPFQANEREKAGVPLMTWPFIGVQHVEQYSYFLQKTYIKGLEYGAFIEWLYDKYTKYLLQCIKRLCKARKTFLQVLYLLATGQTIEQFLDKIL